MHELPAKGWIRLHRRINEHWLWPSRRKFTQLEAWLDLIMMANFKDSKTTAGKQLLVVRRGQALTSQVSLARRWRWNRKSVVAFLKLLKSDSQLDYESSTRTDSGYTLITICNYEHYQTHDEAEADSQTDSEKDSDTGYEGTAKGQPRDTSEEFKNGKKEISPVVMTVIDRLNTLAGKSYSYSKISTEHLCARLKNGATEDDCIAVVEHRWQLWGSDPKMKTNFNPTTLFRPKNFERYLVEARANGKPRDQGVVI